YGDRIRGERAENLEQAITAYQRALEVYTRKAFPENWATTQNNLANAYRNRIRGEQGENLEQAITASEQALEVHTREAFPENWAMHQNNLANAYGDRIRGERAENLEQAITAYERALEVRTRESFPKDWAMTQNNLANAYCNRIRGERADNLNLAIAAYKRALEVYTREAFPKECRRTSGLLGYLHSDLQNWDAATQAYEQALAAAEDLYQACTLLDSQAGELKETADLPRRAAYAYAKAGQLDKALETIERGRARGLSETLRRDRADLAQLQQQRPNLFDRYRDTTNQLQNLERLQRDQQVRDRQALTPEQHRTEAQRLRQDLTDAIAQIRQVPGYETFLQAPSLEEIQQNLSTEAPTVYLIPTPDGSLALIATPHAIAPLWLDDFPEATLIDLVRTWLQAYGDHKVANDEHSQDPESQAKKQARDEKRERWYSAIAQGTRQLWDNLMAPLIDHLKRHNHNQAILIPTGLFGLLPLHAAWTDDPTRPTDRRYALDEILFTYAPNAQSLVAARAIANRHPNPDSILAIDNPRQDLPSSEREVMAAVSTFPRPTILRHQTATTEAVKTALADAATVHFSCHGTTSFSEPLNSGLLMSDGLLTLRDLFALKLTEGNKPGIRLAVLSACETGLPGLELADEAIGLPVGMMQAGVAAIVASLWSVSDLSTSLLLRKFYDLWRKEGKTPPEALRQAQIWLRDSTDGQKKAENMGIRPANPDDRSFAHPFHWSAFSYLGL
ncbi:MAG: CHAT domain-containing protein, partial [Cyanobacteria bacterium]|nr:CHAT domain-containing protein [Cyanobacteriota bacterium]